MNLKQQTTDVYDQWAEKMAEKFAGIGPRTRHIDYTLSFLEKTDPFVVEIGCGDGRDAAEIKKRTPHYLGIDISSGMIEIARSKVPDAQFEVADVETFSFPESMDAVFAFASLLHVPKDAFQSILKRIHRSMRDGAVFHISLKEEDAYQSGIQKDVFGERLFYYYSKEDMRELVDGLFDILLLETEVKKRRWIECTLRKKEVC